MAAGLATLRGLQEPGFYRRLSEATEALSSGLSEAAHDAGVEVTVNSAPGMLTVFFTGGPIRNLEDAERCDTRAFARFFHAMLRRGVYLPPSQFEAWMLSSQHTPDVIEQTLEAAAGAFNELSVKRE
jgi:glutamate-1-semialdehyde 2,1-aminomutase